jgi:hypothetical protein
MEIKNASSTSIGSQLRRRRGTQTSTINAIAVPPVVGHNKFFIRFPALDDAVVATESVDVWFVVPLTPKEAGLKLQVGMSLTFVIDVLTAQLKLTVPEKPLVPTTLIVPVFPVVAPGVSVMEVVSPVPAVKLGSALIVSEMLVVALKVLEVPVIVTVTGVGVTMAELLALRVST